MDEVYYTSVIRKSMPAALLSRMADTGMTATSVKFDMGREANDAIRIFERTQSAMYEPDFMDFNGWRWSPEEVALYKTLGVLQVYTWMAKEYGNAGWSARTIRRYAEVTRFYLTAELDRFNVLPFSHFEFAKKFGRPFAIEILSISIRQMDDNNGRPPSVDWLEFHCGELGYEFQNSPPDDPSHVSPEKDEEKVRKNLQKRISRVTSFLFKQSAKIIEDESDRVLVQSLIERIQNIMRKAISGDDDDQDDNSVQGTSTESIPDRKSA